MPAMRHRTVVAGRGTEKPMFWRLAKYVAEHHRSENGWETEVMKLGTENRSLSVKSNGEPLRREREREVFTGRGNDSVWEIGRAHV